MVLLNIVLRCFAPISEKRLRSKFIDSLRLHVRGGSGGMGHPKFGGVGGPGGNVYAVGNEKLTLVALRNKYKAKRIAAGCGQNSHKRCILGQKGEDVDIEVPIGVTLYSENGRKLGEIDEDGKRVVIGKGGLGGCEGTGHCGLKGETHTVIFDLKLIANVGLVGFPNAGKSTLLSAISNAKPKISSYPFTTVKPNIGRICYPDLRQVSVADLPGLIEGAHSNVGMGHKFLKHVERTQLFLIVVDVGGFRLSQKYVSRSCLETIILLNKELELYREDLVKRPAILVVNKMDKEGSGKIFDEVREAVKDLKGVFDDVPEIMRPLRALQFERVVGLAARRKEQKEIEGLKNIIREVLDSSFITDTGNKALASMESFKRKNMVAGPVMV